jgi:hypothetical protein
MRKSAKKWLTTMSAVAVVLITGCGNNPVAVPAPAANPYGYTAGACGTVGSGQPLTPSGLSAPLYDTNGNAAGSISLSLFLTGQYTATDPTPAIMGSAQITFTNSQYLDNIPAAGQQTAFCVSSSAPTGGTLTGQYYPQNNQFMVTMQGTVSLPSVDPISGYPNGGTAAETVTVSVQGVMTGSTAFQGYVSVQVGQTSYASTFIAQ